MIFFLLFTESRKLLASFLLAIVISVAYSGIMVQALRLKRSRVRLRPFRCQQGVVAYNGLRSERIRILRGSAILKIQGGGNL